MKMHERGVWGGMAVATGMAALMGVAGCASTEMTSTWTDPSAQGAALSKIAVLSMSKDPGIRRMVEDSMAQEMSKRLETAQVVPGYRVLEGIDLGDREAVKRTLRSQGFDGVLINRLAGVQETVIPAGPYRTFNGYYDYAYGAAWGPGPMPMTETQVHVVSSLYSLRQGQLIWSGASKTFDPRSAKDAARDVGQAVAKSLEKDRIVL